MKRIPNKKYAQIIADLPILCVDIVITNEKGEYFLLKRLNSPRKGQWWVIGGRVRKGEALMKAAIRKIKEEAGLEVKKVNPIGYYEEVYRQSPFNKKISYHPVSLVFHASVPEQQKVKLDNQSSSWKYSRKLPTGFRIKLFVSSFKINERIILL